MNRIFSGVILLIAVLAGILREDNGVFILDKKFSSVKSVKNEDLTPKFLPFVKSVNATPCFLSPDAEMKQRFEDYLDQLTKGKEPGKVRIVLE